MGVIDRGCGLPVAILVRNKPAFYCVSPKAYAAMLEVIDDIDLLDIANARDGEESVLVSIDRI